MSRYIPQPAYPDMMPVDISFVFEDEKPAGKHGFVKAVGDDFRFEDGTLARFWGVNFNGGACFPDHDYAKKVATRLAQSGCNIVRFHQLDAEWDTPNIFSFTKGKRVTTTRKMDERSLDALDYLIYALKEEGIYCYLDMNTYRHFKEEDGVDEYEYLMDMGKPWCILDRRMIDLQKEFVTQIWNHYNPYTKLAYKDDPVFVMSEIINECDLFSPGFLTKTDYVDPPKKMAAYRARFGEWLKEHGKTYDWENCDMWRDKSDEITAFRIDVTKAFFKEMYDHMRAVGVKIPITGTNWTKAGGNILSHEELDYTDSHHYFYEWKWGNTERVCSHRAITAQGGAVLGALAKMKVANKPFFCSEWDDPWPNSYRAEGPIYYAAVGALQGWAGFAIHTYAYGTRLDKMEILGKEQSSPVGGVPYREGIFSVWNDPAKFGLFYHAALITRRCDIKPANKNIAVKTENLAGNVVGAYKNLLEVNRAATVFEDNAPGFDGQVLEGETVPLETPGIMMSDNGEMWRDLKKHYGVIDTEMTKVVYGTLARGGAAASTRKNTDVGIKLNGLNVDAITDFGVIAMSSLTKDNIENSDNILISAIGRARNTGAQFDGEKMIERGEAPILAEVVEADIHLKTNKGDKLKVWGVNAEGYYAGKLETTYEDGILSFHIGDALNPACYYLVVAD